MSELEHLSAESLQGYAEGAIGETDRGVLDSHLATCPQCASELEEWRSLFAGLAALPKYEPTHGFADRVMARVRIPVVQPVWAQVVEGCRRVAQRLTPRTAGAWALAASSIILPLLVGGGLVTWLVSKDYITAQSLWAFFSDRATSSMQSLGTSALSTVMESSIANWLVEQARALVASAGTRGLGALGLALGSLTMLSSWILYRNLFRTPTREANHVSSTV